MPTCYLVIGTPRSGTSCVAGILHRLGVFMGDRWLSPCAMNETGFYQDLDFERVFERVPEWMPETVTSEHYDARELHSLIAKRFERGDDWGAKFRHGPLVVDAFAETCGHSLKLVITSRDASLSKQSLSRWMEPIDQDAREVIDRSRAAVQQAIGKLPSIIMPYDALVNDPKSEVSRLARFVGKPATREAIEFVNPKLRHYVHGN